MVAPRNEISVERAREMLSYSPDTGEFRWRSDRGLRKLRGEIAGYLASGGYRQIKIDGRAISAHRLAWLYVHGFWPECLVDHINGDRSDNRIANLREATPAQNMANAKRRRDNRSGLKGAWFHKQCGKWVSEVVHDGERIYLGMFETPESAHAAFMETYQRCYGAYARAE